MDMKTLLDRTNDAINTIIRLDETTETGEFLQPCIEGNTIQSVYSSSWKLLAHQINEQVLFILL